MDDAAYDHPVMHWPRAGILRLVQAIEAGLAARQGFSLIRLGDAEGIVMDHDNPLVADQLSTWLQFWLGDQLLPAGDLDVIRDQMAVAIRAADVLGLPRWRQVRVVPHRRGNQSTVECLPGILGDEGDRPMVVDSGVHNYLQWSGALARLMRRRDRVITLSSRDVGQALQEAFEVRDVQWLAVTAEAAFPGAADGPHWPDGFLAMQQTIATRVQPGDLVLVGAGVLGKIYCGWIKERGGVAVDIGSIFDGWAAVNSRPRLTGSERARIGFLAGLATGDEDLRANILAVIEQTHITDGTF